VPFWFLGGDAASWQRRSWRRERSRFSADEYLEPCARKGAHEATRNGEHCTRGERREVEIVAPKRDFSVVHFEGAANPNHDFVFALGEYVGAFGKYDGAVRGNVVHAYLETVHDTLEAAQCAGHGHLSARGRQRDVLVDHVVCTKFDCALEIELGMSATAAHRMKDVLPPVDLRQWVLTVPLAWRKRLGYDGRLMSALTRIFVKTVLGFYRERSGGPPRGQSGAVVAVQRTSSDLKLNPHVHAVFLDGTYRDKGDELDFRGVWHLSTRDVAAVLERTRDRMVKWLRRRGLLLEESEAEGEGDGLAVLAASAVSGTPPPAGPEWRRGALPFERRPMVFERRLCVALDGFPPSGITKRVTLHAATRAGGHDDTGREALLKYILRPSVAQERVTRGPDGLVRITLKKPFSDGTVAVDLDPLSLLSGCSRRRVSCGPVSRRSQGFLQNPRRTCPRARPEAPIVWAELLKRTFGFNVLTCPCCGGRMKLLALVTDPTSVARYLRGIGEPTDVPKRTPARGPPYWASRVLRRGAGSVEAAE